MELAEITQKLEALEQRASEAVATMEAEPGKYEEMKALVDEWKPEIETLRAERAQAIAAEERKALAGELTTLKGVIEELRKAPEGFFPDADTPEGKAVADGDEPYASGAHGYFSDLRLAAKNDPAARERLTKGVEMPRGFSQTAEGKAMTEGTAAQGGYLVRPLVERQIVQARELDNVLRALCSKINVNTNAIQLDQLTLSTTAGWVAELAAKPEGTNMTLATVTANVFTAAGLATISNQLLADSNPSVDALVIADLAKRLTALEETAFIAGTGTGQPLGILNTPGIGATTVTDATGTAVATILDGILDAIASVETSHGAPSAILMHPRTWTAILKYKPASGAYLIAPGAPNATIPNVQDARTVARGPVRELWGYPVVLSNRIPTNLGAGTNESRVIVADFREALILDRQGLTVDESSHVYFTTNQTVFRAEERVGFTAARTPVAFNVVGGTALANR
jgi:HK97 family phage major capsid protein